MREVLSISGPKATIKKMKNRAKMNDMSVSAWVIRIAEEEFDMISEQELLEDIRVGEAEIRLGSCPVLSTAAAVDQYFKHLS